MKSDILKFLDADDTNFLIFDVELIVRGAVLNEAQIINELEEIKKVFPGSKVRRMNELIEHLISFT
jgi:glycine betaine/choline ABC-type transport system substrate-binding protein